MRHNLEAHEVLETGRDEDAVQAVTSVRFLVYRLTLGLNATRFRHVLILAIVTTRFNPGKVNSGFGFTRR